MSEEAPVKKLRPDGQPYTQAGWRPGAGRPPKGKEKNGGKKQLSRIALEFLNEGAAPAEVMLTSMRRFYARALTAQQRAAVAETEDLRADLERETDFALRLACDIAKDVAPYVHPKLNAIALAENKDAVAEAFELFNPEILRSKLLGLSSTKQIVDAEVTDDK
jgi:hypothetical protein